MIAPELQKFLQALTNENRQRILFLLAEGKGLTVGEVAARTGLGLSTASEHLKFLKEAGFLTSQKSGKEVAYRVDGTKIRHQLGLLQDLLRSCC